MALRILVLGAGATGGYFAGHLCAAARAGRTDAELTFLVRPRRARFLAEGGLRLEGGPHDFALPVRAITAVQGEPPPDLILMSCKAYDLEDAITAIAPAVGPSTLILPILNGLAHYPRLDERFGRSRVLGGLCYLAAALRPDGVIAQLGPAQRITYGLRADNAAHASAVLAALHAAFATTPVDARLSEAIEQDAWEKFVFLASLAAGTCLMRAAIGDIIAVEGGEATMLRLLGECEAAARSAGHPSRPEAAASSRRALTAAGSPATASMLRDLEGGGRTEADHIVGDMLQRSLTAGCDVQVLQLAYTHLKARDARLKRELLATAG
jgi:2-dehydropantoate 2-reductase